MKATVSDPANVPVVLPSLGESVTEATIVAWLKQPGDPVALDEEIVEITSDKADLQVPSPAAGVLAEIVAQPGDTIQVGELLARLAPEGASVAAGAGASSASADAAGSAPQAAEPATTATATEPQPVTADGEIMDVTLPSLGESVTEATIVEWLKQPGDQIALDEEIVEITSDKADLEVPSPAAGVLTEIVAQPGDTVEVGGLLARLAQGATATPTGDDGATKDTTGAAAAPVSATPTNGKAEGGGLVSPLARRRAAEAGVDLDAVSGSGPRGRVTAADVSAAASGGTAAPADAPAPDAAKGTEEKVLLKGPPAALARYMNESRSLPTATTFRTIPVGTLDTRRRQINEALKEAGRDEKLSFTHLVAWAIVRSVEAFPVMATAFEEVDGKPHKVVRTGVNIGLAVDVERRDGSRSLLVPVVRDAQTLGFKGFVDAYDDLVKKTRGGKVSPDDLVGAHVSLTNPGGFGTVASVPRLMPGQGTIIATGSIALPVGFEHVDAKALGIQKVMTATSTYDHRVIQGAESGAFLRQIDLFLAGEDGFYEDVAQSLGIPLPELPAPTTQQIATTSAGAVAPAAAAGPVDAQTLAAVAAATSLVKAHRLYGHLNASLDPLGYPPVGDPALEPATAGISPQMMERVPAELLKVYFPARTFAEVLPVLRETYCGTIAYQVEHIASHEQRRWLRKEIEAGFIRVPMPRNERVSLLERLTQVDLFERFLQRAYIGQKTFSIEGVDAVVPMLDETIELCAESGANQIVIGMAHRGRLNVITHVVGRPVESILGEFEGMTEPADPEDWIQTAGDVKYHLGAEGTFTTTGGRPVAITLAANPSHLEQVNAVVEGGTRARQTLRQGRDATHDPSLAVPVLVHGDAAFPGQGMVAETLNLNGLRGYSTGGTIHIIANNQIGFTTDPQDSRSTRYASDLAKGFDIPIIHVNADDVEACISAVKLAVAYRNMFKRDILIDVIGYRRHGHNEADEPAYTQPVMTQTIKAHPRPYQVYAKRLIEEGVIGEDDLKEIETRINATFSEAREKVMALVAAQEGEPTPVPQPSPQPHVDTAVGTDTLEWLNEALLTVPDGFTVHPKLVPQLQRRRDAMEAGEGFLWAHAESLALGSLLIDGVPVRLTGQDVERGTFSQRHLRLHDAAEKGWKPFTGNTYAPICNLTRATAAFEVFNSPLSEAACIGFEYGYSTLAPETLVIWEAQYGDFANGGQIMFDQFISSGRAKWGERSRLVLLLPHGYEGNGPEHSSARIERFLQACAEDNIRVAVPSTADNYFHLLRRQGLHPAHRPLVVFTPKSLLRSTAASCTLDSMVEGRFRKVVDDPRAADRRDQVTRLVLCTGKVYHDLDASEARETTPEVAIARVELIYPIPEEELAEVIAGYPNLTEVTWVQEEPRNMGAWTFLRRTLERLLDATPLSYCGRSTRSSPAEGYPQMHKVEQERIIREAFMASTERPAEAG